jgi:hypothetical protein
MAYNPYPAAITTQVGDLLQLVAALSNLSWAHPHHGASYRWPLPISSNIAAVGLIARGYISANRKQTGICCVATSRMHTVVLNRLVTGVERTCKISKLT